MIPHFTGSMVFEHTSHDILTLLFSSLFCFLHTVRDLLTAPPLFLFLFSPVTYSPIIAYRLLSEQRAFSVLSTKLHSSPEQHSVATAEYSLVMLCSYPILVKPPTTSILHMSLHSSSLLSPNSYFPVTPFSSSLTFLIRSSSAPSIVSGAPPSLSCPELFTLENSFSPNTQRRML